jgi:phosphatidylglycerophosphate synthase
VTRLGEILDQFSDLCFESLGLTMLIGEGGLPAFVLPVYLLREYWVTTIRRHMAGQQVNIPSTFVGKLKTNFIMWGFLPLGVSASGLLPALEPWVGHLGRFGVTVGLTFGYMSGWHYTKAFVTHYRATP